MWRLWNRLWNRQRDPDAPAEPPPVVPLLEASPNSEPDLQRRPDRRSRTLWANGASLTLHALLLLVFARITLSGSAKVLNEIHAWTAEEIPDTEIAPPLDPTDLKLAEPSEAPSASIYSGAAANYSQLPSDAPQMPIAQPAETGPPELAMTNLVDPGGLDLEELFLQRGAAGEEVANVEGAVDRITHEIIANLEQGDVLVVWLLDASISLFDDRAAVADRLQRVFRELDQVKVDERALLNAVASYGEGIEFLLPPSADRKQVVETIRNVPVDETGVENVFGAIVRCIDQYKTVRAREHRRMMFVIWTDESGDDIDRLDDAVRRCQKLAIPVFTVGPSSMFGRQKAVHAYKRPEDGKTYEIEVDCGPDTVQYERLRLPYWFSGPQYERLPAGIGPFALTRLAVETGGAYFINESASKSSPFSLADLRPYLPDYSSISEYRRQLAGSRLRQAIVHAVEITLNRELKGTPQLEFEPTGDNYQRQLSDAQQSVAFNDNMLTAALLPFGTNGFEADYEKEKSPRWKAWYDLTYGRLLAMQVRCHEYNWTCAEMKAKGADFVNQQSNRWTFKPSSVLKIGTASERQAAEAERLLKRCVEQNRGTPWEKLAQRELEYPFGFEIEERFVPPPPAPNDLGGGGPMMGRRVEQPRRLDRDDPVQLPRL